MALDTTYTSATFNTYITEAEADTLVGNQEILNGSIGWSSLPAGSKEVHILNAVREVNAKDWAGARSAGIIVTNMEFPRSGLTYKDGSAVPDTLIPEDIKSLTACYIYKWIKTGGSGQSTAVIGAVKSKSVGGVTIQYETGGGSSTTTTLTTDEDACLSGYIDDSWIGGGATTSLAGIGSVGKTRGP